MSRWRIAKILNPRGASDQDDEPLQRQLSSRPILLPWNRMVFVSRLAGPFRPASFELPTRPRCPELVRRTLALHCSKQSSFVDGKSMMVHDLSTSQ